MREVPAGLCESPLALSALHVAVTADAPCGAGPDTRADPATEGGSLIGSGQRVAAWDVVTVTTPAGATPCSIVQASLVDALNEQGESATK